MPCRKVPQNFPDGPVRCDNKTSGYCPLRSDVTHFSVVIYNANFNDAQNDAQTDAQTDAQNEMENLIIRLIEKNKYITRLEMAEKIGKSKATIERIIKKSKKIKYVGSSKKGYWEIVE